MKMVRIIILVLGAALLILLLRGEPAAPPAPASSSEQFKEFKLQDFWGADYSLSQWDDKRAVVVVFLGTECPLAKLYGQRLTELAQQYEPQGVQFVGILSNRQDSLEEMAHYARLHEIEFPLLKDPGNQVADQLGATRTPEAFVLDPQRVVRYQGRIDDQYGIGFSRAAYSRSHLTAALDELLAGKEVSVPKVEAVGCIIGRVHRGEPTGEITYCNQIARILNDRCVSCHREGQIAPFALTDYDEVVGWADTMLEVIDNGRMPPWHANPEHGQFLNDASMPDEEKRLFSQWVTNGTPVGDRADLPPPPEFHEGWRIPQPDVVFRMPEAYQVPAKGVVPYQHFYLDPGFTEDMWVCSTEARPGNRSVVHHLILFYLPPGQQRHKPEDPLFNTIASFAPGMPALVAPEGCALRIPAGSQLVFQVHYTPNGSPQTDISEAGLIFLDPKRVKKELDVEAALNWQFIIPPGAKDYRVSAEYRIPQDSLLYDLTPHMHWRGKSFRFTAQYPDGSEEILLDVPRYDFNWQNIYLLAEPKRLPESTNLLLEARYDNSAENLLNPDPTKSVHWGDQTWDEMMIGSFTLSRADQDLTLGPPRVEALANERYRVHFRYQPSQPVDAVYLAGSFNDWQRDSLAMEGPDGQGWYRTQVELDRGTYEYKFVLNGRSWRADPGNGHTIRPYGNSVVEVE